MLGDQKRAMISTTGRTITAITIAALVISVAMTVTVAETYAEQQQQQEVKEDYEHAENTVGPAGNTNYNNKTSHHNDTSTSNADTDALSQEEIGQAN